jgi:hypothetical protein
VIIPAGVLAPTGTMTLVVHPKVDGIVFIAGDHFTDLALIAVSAQYQLFLPLTLH